MIHVPLCGGHVALADDEDAIVLQFRWYARKCYQTGKLYAARKVRIDGKSVVYFLHHAVLPAPAGLEVDHRNGNPLDCRRRNLRLATHAENVRNSGLRSDNASGFKGVHFDRPRARWQAMITCNGSRRALGRFATAEEAARAYDAAARELHGEFARLNFPPPEVA